MSELQFVYSAAAAAAAAPHPVACGVRCAEGAPNSLTHNHFGPTVVVTRHVSCLAALVCLLVGGYLVQSYLTRWAATQIPAGPCWLALTRYRMTLHAARLPQLMLDTARLQTVVTVMQLDLQAGLGQNLPGAEGGAQPASPAAKKPWPENPALKPRAPPAQLVIAATEATFVGLRVFILFSISFVLLFSTERTMAACLLGLLPLNLYVAVSEGRTIGNATTLLKRAENAFMHAVRRPESPENACKTLAENWSEP